MFSQIIVNIIVPYFVKKRQSDKMNTVHFPLLYTVIGCLCLAFFLAFLIVCIIQKEDLWVSAGFATFCLLGIYIILYCLLNKIVYNEEYFVYRSMFGRITKVQYSDITKIKRNKSKDVSLYTNTKRYFVDNNAMGSDEFLEVISRKALMSKPITQESKRKQLKRLEKHKQYSH